MIDRVAYLSIDMNITLPEKAALAYFWPKLVCGAIVVFDDYNWLLYREQKLAHDAFAKSVGTQILPMPTGQGVLIRAVTDYPSGASRKHPEQLAANEPLRVWISLACFPKAPICCSRTGCANRSTENGSLTLLLGLLNRS